MKLVNGKLILERKSCTCQNGTMPSKKPCQDCKGTGKGKRGKINGCKHCFGKGTTWDHDNPITCNECNGNYVNHFPETTCDYLPNDIWDNLTFKVTRVQQEMTFNESYLGLGCVFSCTDYGAAYENKDDNTIIKEVKDHKGHQACKVAKDDGTLCDYVAIVVKPQGYRVQAVFN